MGLPGDENDCLHVCASVFIWPFVLCTPISTLIALMTDHWACKEDITSTECNEVQGTASVFMYIGIGFILLPIKVLCWNFVCCLDNNNNLLIIEICFSISASFSFVGCLIHAGEVASSQLGYSFYLGLIPGLSLLLLTLLVIFSYAANHFGWKLESCSDLQSVCCKENDRIEPSDSNSQDNEQVSEGKPHSDSKDNGQVSEGRLHSNCKDKEQVLEVKHNDGLHVFTVLPSYVQVLEQTLVTIE